MGDSNIASSASTETSTLFEKFFQSTLQRAYSTRTTLQAIKEKENLGGSTNGFQKSKTVDPSDVVDSILDATIVSEENDNGRSQQRIASAVNAVVDTTIASTTQNEKYARKTNTQKQRQTQEHHSKKATQSSRYEFPFATSYKSHPALNNVALAHALWASVVRPNGDTVIDATCGNGNDSIVLAEILFGNNDNHHDDDVPCELLCMDVQSLACERTTEALKEVLPPSIRVMGPEDDFENDDSNKVVRVLNASHETLPRPLSSPVGLIVYNLGWLPGQSEGKDCVTTMETTIASLVDALQVLRVGGMLSVITYPQTGPEEDAAVQLLLTCVALLSSRTRTWQEEIDNYKGPAAVVQIVRIAMEEKVPQNQTWRVSQHDKLGMDRPPVLFTATRIK